MGPQRLLSWVAGLWQNGRAVRTIGVLGASASPRSTALVELLGPSWCADESRPEDAHVKFEFQPRVFVAVYLIDERGPEAAVRVIENLDPSPEMGDVKLDQVLSTYMVRTEGSDLDRVHAAVLQLMNNANTVRLGAAAAFESVVDARGRFDRV